MQPIENAIERIKILECPTGNLENRIAGILEDYGVSAKGGINVARNEKYDKDGAEAYIAKVSGSKEQSIVVLAESGLDDYVAKVTDVYIK
jgi:hypothetical protein